MKNAILILTALLMSTVFLSAQQETLFGRGHSSGFFAGPIFEYSMWDKELRVSSGGGLGLVVDNFFIGGYGLAAVDLDALLNDNGERVEIDIAHSGLWLGYSWPSHKLFHIFGSVKGGWGLVNTTVDRFGVDNSDQVFVVTPDIGVEVNVFRWFRLAGTVGYRAVNGINENSVIDQNAFNGMTGGLTLRFGWFGRHHKRFDHDD